jgi:hypothetical protein
MNAGGSDCENESNAFYQRVIDAFAKDLDLSATVARIHVLLDDVIGRSLCRLRPYIVALFCLLLVNTALHTFLCWKLIGKALPARSMMMNP